VGLRARKSPRVPSSLPRRWLRVNQLGCGLTKRLMAEREVPLIYRFLKSLGITQAETNSES
jgi:hypothetical protein